jgi:inhibitor of cysteine peptidase
MQRLIVIILIGLLCSCRPKLSPVKSTEQSTGGTEPSPNNAIKQLAETDTGHSIELHVGDTLELTLSSNPTTGFQWEVSDRDITILQPSGEPEFESSSDSVGSGGKTIMRFKVVGTGQTKLKLIYHRPFEKDVPPVQIFEVDVTVR